MKKSVLSRFQTCSYEERLLHTSLALSAFSFLAKVLRLKNLNSRLQDRLLRVDKELDMLLGRHKL